MNISISVMAHWYRQTEAHILFNKLLNMPFMNVVMVFDSKNDEWDTGKQALESHDKSDYHLVIQDDATIGDNFYRNVEAALNNIPQESLVSFYTGIVRPRATKISVALKKAECKSWLAAETLLWGVCIAIPTKDIEPMLNYVKDSNFLYDKRIGSYYRHNNRPVYYTNPSLVDHNWKLPSLTGHDKYPVKRVAHNFSDDIIEWNNLVEEII